MTALEDEQILLPSKVREVIARSVSIPRGLALIDCGPVECVAAALGVDVWTLEDVRARLQRPGERETLIQEYVRALEGGRCHPPAEPGKAPESRLGPEDLAGKAAKHALGVQFLLCAHPETVAVTFGVHPDIVLGARDVLVQRGVLPEAFPE